MPPAPSSTHLYGGATSRYRCGHCETGKAQKCGDEREVREGGRRLYAPDYSAEETEVSCEKAEEPSPSRRTIFCSPRCRGPIPLSLFFFSANQSIPALLSRARFSPRDSDLSQSRPSCSAIICLCLLKQQARSFRPRQRARVCEFLTAKASYVLASQRRCCSGSLSRSTTFFCLLFLA